jgi:hypothetical protein
MTPPGELLIPLVVGTVLGGIIGYERDVHGRPAGLRTHLIVAEHKDDGLLRRRISLVFAEGGPSVPARLGALTGAGFVVSPAEYERRVHVTLQAQVPAGSTERLVDRLESQPGLERVRVEPTS